MKLFIFTLFCSLALGAHSQNWFLDAGRFIKEAGQETWDMWRAYSDMREANFKNSDEYFHARGNYDAAKRGPGGAWAAEILSDGREFLQGGSSGRGVEDSLADQEANRHGRSGGDPNHYRPAGLDEKY
ncbi:serum amyloid A protein isoform X1 [Tachyglossus aculeatus]|uniref:serum amyloid A protein isoform X1 n=2 Tax=Tachyglossus aculeatus TaxID=9261 RepID=UPI0018F2FDED|nr:serum amyloid A protein isoform X1 [Tachyglossus aculeatus]